jgi:hypothetical protein
MTQQNVRFAAMVALACLTVGSASYGVTRARMRASRRGVVASSQTIDATREVLAETTLATEPGPTGGGPVASVAEATPDAGADVEPAGFGVEGADAAQPDAQSQIDLDFLVSLAPLEPRTPEAEREVKRMLSSRRILVSQGNPRAVHEISRASCLKGLEGVVLQTPKQREICGHENEVPVYADGDVESAKVCIDQFEYPNHACGLPFVFSNPIQSEKLCEMAGKRLCKDEEWDTACEADPQGGKPSQYAYGDALDLAICNTGKPWAGCVPDKDLWNTCPTETEPSGAFPKCRSRLGVYDQHGNIAEFMSRLEPSDRVVYVQMKGSAWFYDGRMYKDHCRFDPRWHVDPLNASWHANYHLGARCCRDVVPLKERGKSASVDAGSDASSDARSLGVDRARTEG